MTRRKLVFMGMAGLIPFVTHAQEQGAPVIRGGVEDYGYPQLCHACPAPLIGEEPFNHPALFVVMWPKGMVRLCHEHLLNLQAVVAELV